MIQINKISVIKLVVFVVVLIFSSCRQKPVIAPVSFDFIDLTMVHGWTTTSLHLYNNKKMIACTALGQYKEKYYKEMLDSKSMAVVDSLVPIILKTQDDTTAGAPVPDGTAFKFILSANNKKITVVLFSPDDDVPVAKLAYTLFNVVENLRMPVDTSFVFPSRDFLPKETPE